MDSTGWSPPSAPGGADLPVGAAHQAWGAPRRDLQRGHRSCHPRTPRACAWGMRV